MATAALMRRFHPADGLAVAGIALVSGVYNPHLERLARANSALPPRIRVTMRISVSMRDDTPRLSIVDLVDVQPIRTLITYAELDLLANAGPSR